MAGLENMDLLAEPGFAAEADAVWRYYAADPGMLVVTTALGLVALLPYVAFVLGWWRLLSGPGTGDARGDRRGVRARRMLLGAGIIAVSLAAVSHAYRLAATAAARADAGAMVVAHHHALYLTFRLAGALAYALALLAAATAGLRAGFVPRWLATAGIAVGCWLLPATLFAVAASQAQPVALAGFVAATAWIAGVGIWLLMPPSTATSARFGRLTWLIFFLVCVAAGVSGVALIVFPGKTGWFFSWPLGPPTLATLVGANYLIAAAVYGWALRRGGPERRPAQARGLLFGVIALSVPIFGASLAHLDAFDFTRWQAWAWIVLFGAFPVAAATALRWAPREMMSAAASPAAPALPRAGLLRAFAGGLTLVAGAALLRPDLATAIAFHPGPFGVRVFAGWMLFVAALALWTAIRPRAESGPARTAIAVYPLAWVAILLAAA